METFNFTEAKRFMAYLYYYLINVFETFCANFDQGKIYFRLGERPNR